MIKKLLVVSSIVLSANLFGARAPKNFEISHGKIPLLFQFMPSQKTIRVSALTQSWIEVNDRLKWRARISIDSVVMKVRQHIVKEALEPSDKTCSYVLDDYGRVYQYDVKNKHKNYFLQELLVIETIANIQHAKPRVSLPSVKKGPIK